MWTLPIITTLRFVTSYMYWFGPHRPRASRHLWYMRYVFSHRPLFQLSFTLFLGVMTPQIPVLEAAVQSDGVVRIDQTKSSRARPRSGDEDKLMMTNGLF